MSPLLFKSPLPDTINFTLKSRHSVNFSPKQTQLNIPAEEVGHRGDFVHVTTALQVPTACTINFTLKSRHSVNFSPIQTQLNIPAEEVGHRGDLVHVTTALQVPTAWHNQFHSKITSFCQLQPYTDTTEHTCRGGRAQRRPCSCHHCSSSPHCLTQSISL